MHCSFKTVVFLSFPGILVILIILYLCTCLPLISNSLLSDSLTRTADVPYVFTYANVFQNLTFFLEILEKGQAFPKKCLMMGDTVSIDSGKELYLTACEYLVVWFFFYVC